MPLLTSLLVLLVASRLLGALFARLRQPAIVGEMAAGVLLGPSVLDLVKSTPELAAVSSLAVFLVVLSAGLEMDSRQVLGAMGGKGLVVALAGFALPLVSGLALGVAFELDVMRTVFLGLCISITALPVAVRILGSFKMLDTAIARYSIATAVVNDVAALLVLGVILSLPEGGSLRVMAESVLAVGGKLLCFAALVAAFNWLLARLERRSGAMHRFSDRIVDVAGSEGLFGVVVMFVLLFASASEVLGFHFVIGAFFGALLLDKGLFSDERREELRRTLGSVSDGFLAPLFFATLGLEFRLGALRSVEFVAAVIAASVASKLLAGYLAGRLIRLSQAESWGIGIILNGRGVMELVIASIAYEHRFIGPGIFSTLVLMGVLTTIMTPVLFRRFVEPRMAARAAPLTPRAAGAR